MSGKKTSNLNTPLEHENTQTIHEFSPDIKRANY
jgi:hypothetical protein